MCLVKVRQEEDVVVPYRVVRTTSPPRRRTSRISRTIVSDGPSYSHSHHSIVTPTHLTVPAPQPVPVFVQTPTPPPPPPPPAPPSVHTTRTQTHYVDVSPSSSSSRADRDYIVHETRPSRRDYSPSTARSSSRGRSPRYASFRYVNSPPEDPYVRRSRSRSVHRSYYDDDDYHDSIDSFHDHDRDRYVRDRITITEHQDGRRRSYRH